MESPLFQQYYLVKLQLLNTSSKFFIILLFFRNEILRGKFIQYFRFVFCTRIAIYIFIFQTNFFPFLVCCIVIRKQIALKARRSHPQGAQIVGGVDNRDKILHDAFFFSAKGSIRAIHHICCKYTPRPILAGKGGERGGEPHCRISIVCRFSSL